MNWEKVADHLEKFSTECSYRANELMAATSPSNPVVQSSQTTASILGGIARALRAGLLKPE